MAFSTKIKGNLRLQGNVQMYNVRDPVRLAESQAKPPGGANCEVPGKTARGQWTNGRFSFSLKLSHTGSAHVQPSIASAHDQFGDCSGLSPLRISAAAVCRGGGCRVNALCQFYGELAWW